MLNTQSNTDEPQEREIFSRAIRLDDANERQDYLDQACGENSALRDRVDRLIAAHNSKRPSPLADVIKQLVPAARTGILSAADDTPISFRNDGPLAGELLDRFELIRLVGRGGMGNVFYARDTRLDRPVAIKLPRLDTIGVAGLRQRFLREARMAARLDHPLLVPVLEVGQAGNHLYTASQWCAGGDLKAWIDKNPGPYQPHDVARLLIKLCQAVGYCHQANVLHLDLKPSNILLAEPAAEGNSLDQLQIRMTDFGVARTLEHSAAETLSSLALGTPHYMAPEQAGHNAKPPRATADVYSLGVILYELLYGRRPIEGDDPIEVLSRLRGLDYVDCPALTRLPKDLRTICGKCLSRSPEDRYASVDRLQQDLRHFLDGRPIAARPHSWSSRFSAWCRKEDRIRQAGALAIAQELAYLFMFPLPVVLHAAGYQLPDEFVLTDWVAESIPLLLLIVLPLLVNGIHTLRMRRYAILFGCVWSIIPAILITAVIFGFPSVFSVYHDNPLANLMAHAALAIFGWVQVVFYLLAIPAALVRQRSEHPNLDAWR